MIVLKVTIWTIRFNQLWVFLSEWSMSFFHFKNIKNAFSLGTKTELKGNLSYISGNKLYETQNRRAQNVVVSSISGPQFKSKPSNACISSSF